MQLSYKQLLDSRSNSRCKTSTDVAATKDRETHAFSMKYAVAALLLALAVLSPSVLSLPVEPEVRFTSTTPSSSTTKTRPDLNPDHASNVCVSMLPVHGPNVPSNSPAPYTVTVSANSAVEGDVIEVTVSGKRGSSFKGVYMQGRINDKPVGQWLPMPENPQVFVSNCEPGKENAVSYVSRNVALEHITFKWTAPAISGDLIFKATVVKTYAEYWANVDSPVVRINK